MAGGQSAVVCTEQFRGYGRLEIRAVGTEEFYLPPHWQDHDPTGFCNVIRLTFKPGTISVCQQLRNPASAFPRLESDLYMWHATFNTADLRDIRVKEQSQDTGTYVDLLAVCMAPPVGHGQVAKAGSEVKDIFKVAVDTSEPNASSIAIATLSDRWASGEQEIKLSFRLPKQKKRPLARKSWRWDAFLAFLCGVEWSTPTTSTGRPHGYRRLAEIVNSKSPNPYAEIEEKDDGWVWIKIKPNAEPTSSVPVPLPDSNSILNKNQERGGEYVGYFIGDLPIVLRNSSPPRSPPTSGLINPSYLRGDLSLPMLEPKGKATCDVEEDGCGNRADVEHLQNLERARDRARDEAAMSRKRELRWKTKKEEEYAKANSLEHLIDLARLVCPLEYNPNRFTDISFVRVLESQVSTKNDIESSQVKNRNEWLNEIKELTMEKKFRDHSEGTSRICLITVVRSACGFYQGVCIEMEGVRGADVRAAIIVMAEMGTNPHGPAVQVPQDTFSDQKHGKMIIVCFELDYDCLDVIPTEYV